MSKTWIVIIVIVLIIGGVWLLKGRDGSMPTVGSTSSPTASAKASSSPVSQYKTVSPAPVSGLSYTQLVSQFGDNRIQFDASCQASPKTFALKNGSQILLDNRANQTRTISIDGKSYSLAAFGYRIVTLSSATLPKVLNVSCNNQINTATINLQANISGQ